MSGRSSTAPLRFPTVPALDGLRGLAALAVVIHHGLGASGAPSHIHSWFDATQTISSFGYLGVDLFFVLSGYLITSLLLLARRRPSFYRNFYIKRVFRILPALILVLLLIRVLWPTHVPWSSILLALFFLSNIPLFWSRVPSIGPFWSLATEEQFYLLWPTIVHRTRPHILSRLLIALIATVVVVRTIEEAFHGGRAQYTPLHCDGLAWGALLAILALRARVPFRTRNASALWRSLGRWALLTGALLMLLSVILLRAVHNDFGLPVTAAAPLFAGTLAFLLTHPSNPLARALASAPLRILGAISYMVYLSHSYIMELFDNHFRGWPGLTTHTLLAFRLIVVLVFTLLWSLFSLYTFERPIGRLRRHFLRPD
jgi:peptidoglycan/LPS O-acetylase OafA/YrhL